jgi:hypothetical protein
LTNELQLDIDFLFLTTFAERGGAEIDSYEIQKDDGAAGDFYEVIGNLNGFQTQNSYLITSGVASGLSYRVRYRAHNVHGWGGFSPELLVLAATIPDKIAEPQTSIEGIQLRVDWIAPFSGG